MHFFKQNLKDNEYIELSGIKGESINNLSTFQMVIDIILCETYTKLSGVSNAKDLLCFYVNLQNMYDFKQQVASLELQHKNDSTSHVNYYMSELGELKITVEKHSYDYSVEEQILFNFNVDQTYLLPTIKSLKTSLLETAICNEHSFHSMATLMNITETFQNKKMNLYYMKQKQKKMDLEELHAAVYSGYLQSVVMVGIGFIIIFMGKGRFATSLPAIVYSFFSLFKNILMWRDYKKSPYFNLIKQTILYKLVLIMSMIICLRFNSIFPGLVLINWIISLIACVKMHSLFFRVTKMMREF